MGNKPHLLIIGAGLSGLYSAYLLQEDFHVTIVETRERIGGRIHTIDGHDMGPSWVWSHHKNILHLVQEFKLELFAQYTQGLALYDVADGVQRFTPPPQAPAARIKGGISSLTQALAHELKAGTLTLNETLISIAEVEDQLHVTTSKRTLQTDYIISTLPPRIAAQSIEYNPPLPSNQVTLMQNTPTWMAHTCKCVMTFSQAFWRDQGLSGFSFSHLGPLGEIHDACTDEQAALFGFLHAQASQVDIIENIKAQLLRLFGDDIQYLQDIIIVDWRQEKFTAIDSDKKGLREHPNYGLTMSHFNDKLTFVGTESSFEEGGYLEGAIISAKDTADSLKKRLN